MHKFSMLLLAALLLASCASFNAPVNYDFDTKSQSGLAVFSFTSEGILGNFFLKYRSLSNGPDGDITQWTNRNPLDWNGKFIGRLVTLELPAGNYEIYWLSDPHNVRTARAFSIPFQVFPNKATYFGNVHIKVPDRTQFKPSVTDKSERDLQLFFSRYTKIRKTELVKDISQFN